MNIWGHGDGERNRKHNARLVWFGFAVWSTSNPSSLLDVVSVTNFVAWKISCSVFETRISFRFVVPTFLRASGRTWCEITSRRSRNWLVSSLSPHVPNMVLAKMNNYKHQSKPNMGVTRFKSLWVSDITYWRLKSEPVIGWKFRAVLVGLLPFKTEKTARNVNYFAVWKIKGSDIQL